MNKALVGGLGESVDFRTYDSACEIERQIIYEDMRAEIATLTAALRKAEADLREARNEWESAAERASSAHALYLEERAARESAEQALEAMRDRKDGAYLERNQVVAALAKCFPSGTAKTAIEGWSDDWHGCVYIDLPTGQVSWHYHDSHAHLFADLPRYHWGWDGHDTPEKYRRLAALRRAMEGEK